MRAGYCVVAGGDGVGAVSGGVVPPNQPTAQRRTSSATTTARTAAAPYQRRLSLDLVLGVMPAPPPRRPRRAARYESGPAGVPAARRAELQVNNVPRGVNARGGADGSAPPRAAPTT